MQTNWISVKEKLPESGQEVIVYYHDEPAEVHQVYLATYFKKGGLIDSLVDYSEKTWEKRLLNTLFNPKHQLKAPEDAFYIYDDGWRKHADVITHWMPLPGPPVFKRCAICGEWADVTNRRTNWNKHDECANRERVARFREKKRKEKEE